MLSGLLTPTQLGAEWEHIKAADQGTMLCQSSLYIPSWRPAEYLTRIPYVGVHCSRVYSYN